MPTASDDMKEEDIKLIHYNYQYKPWHYDNIPYAKYFWDLLMIRAMNTKPSSVESIAATVIMIFVFIIIMREPRSSVTAVTRFPML